MGIIDYDKATYSLALIDFDLFIESLNDLDKHMKDARENLYLIINKDDPELVDYMETYALRKFKVAKRFFDTIRRDINKYTNKLKIFLSKNPKSKAVFDAKVKELTELMTEKETVIDNEIALGEDYISRNKKHEDSVD